MKRTVLVGGALLLPALAAAAHSGAGRVEAYARDLPGAQRTLVRQVVPKGPADVADLGPLPPQLRESSGLAASRAHPGVFWSHNDSGDGPRLYAVDTAAALLVEIEVTGARAADWEAMDLGVCPDVGAAAAPWCLYVADIGDNAGRRRAVQVYVVPEPDPRAGTATADPLGAVSFSYPEGPSDAEALAVTPNGGLVVVTKWGTAKVYRIAAADVRRSLTRGDTLLLDAGLELPIRSSFLLGGFVTGASLDAAGSTLAVRTYAELHFLRWPLGAPPTEAAPPCFLGTLQTQGEAVALLPDGRALLSSESLGGAAGRLLSVACQGTGGEAPGG